MPRDETAPTPDDRIDDLWDEVQALWLAVMALMRALKDQPCRSRAGAAAHG